MRTDSFTKTLLVVIALALVILAGQGWNSHSITVKAATSHEDWEYKFISWSYGFKGPSVGGYTSWKEDGHDLPLVDGKADLGGKIQALGLRVSHSTYRAISED
ncbi:MAG: hypothetical protein RB191_17385 [Terriglobia bacterium]|nr:hypothetical protein [Terriglobia bacterium]